MKETVRASLAGIGFVFDKDAFEVMEAYLDKLSTIYKHNPDGQEIIADIEARAVEIILSRQSSEQVVNKATAEEVVSQLGTPEEVGGEAAPAAGQGIEESSFPRRLYRNLEGAKLGGVCNGLASYFDVDPVLVRIAMITPVFLLIIFPSVGFHALNAFLGSLFGAICFLYIIMWFAVPAAKTPRQKLEMRGRRITASEIEREMVVSTATYNDARPPQSSFARLFSILGTVILFFVKFILLVIGFAFAMCALAIFVAIIGLLLGKTWINMGGWENLGDLYFGHASTIPAAGFMAMVLGVILIPMVMLVYQMIRMSLNRKNNNSFMWILGGAWILLAVFTTITALSNDGIFREFRGIHYELRHSDVPDSGDGWEIYEENVRRYREQQRLDSLEKLGLLPQAEPLQEISDVTEIENIGELIDFEAQDAND